MRKNRKLEEDRRVHATLGNGAEIVRYDRAGKWYYEHEPIGAQPVRRQLSLTEAVQFVGDEDEWHDGLPGGTQFDRRLKLKFDSARRVR